MDAHSIIASWMLAGGLMAPDTARDRNREHVRALMGSRPAQPGIVTRVATALAAIRPGTRRLDPARCPAECPA